MLEYASLIIFAACLIGFIMTWGVGANDLANIMSTTIGSRAISIRTGIIIAIIFEFAGALLGGEHVTNTVRSGIINANLLSHHPYTLVFGLLSVLIASSAWMLLASYLGMPVSITNAIVGGLVGLGAIVLGAHAVHWGKVGAIAASWILSPTIACIVAYLLFQTIRRSIFNTTSPAKNAKRFLPAYFFLVGIVLADMTILKGLRHFGIEPSHLQSFGIVFIAALIITLFGLQLAKRTSYQPGEKRFKQHIYIEKLFSLLMAFTACAMVFAHGSNDVAIAMGPVSALISAAHHHGHIVGNAPGWILWFGCLGVVCGLIMYGRKVIKTVGHNITDLTPSRAFAATLASAATVIVSTSTGIPVSATQTLVGGVLGVGLARGIGALNIKTVRNILLSWFVTIPASAGLAILCFYCLTYLFGV
ncbi:MAG: phosphate permease [Gammaproteobacteria bacterium CG11_big_fil_rev_8_21_14_0_20_46_22]|nr:MAG: phosphate permease [Gammaproteobacteria bacterium CG12_big_fil_rev_8_21_14_0_65_46_12]PIR11034.1 MAG: phosphate permease [Gammaproteobacteria bacterium CG11_big_fil_rev_8_21_14_0_20_46_22]